MAKQGAALQTYNNELVKSLEELCQRRHALQVCKGPTQGLYNRWIGPSRATSALRALCIKWKTVGGKGQGDLLVKNTQNARGEGVWAGG